MKNGLSTRLSCRSTPASGASREGAGWLASRLERWSCFARCKLFARPAFGPCSIKPQGWRVRVAVVTAIRAGVSLAAALFPAHHVVKLIKHDPFQMILDRCLEVDQLPGDWRLVEEGCGLKGRHEVKQPALDAASA